MDAQIRRPLKGPARAVGFVRALRDTRGPGDSAILGLPYSSDAGLMR